MKTFKYIAAFGLILLSLQAIQAQNTLDDYLALAAKNNPKVQATFSTYMAALQRVPQAKALPDPQLAFGYFIKPIETRLGPQQAKISFTQMFPWFGLRDALSNAAAQYAKAKYELFEQAKSQVYYEVKSNWYNLYFTHRAIQVSQDNLKLLETFKKLALVKVETGKTSAVDELRVEMSMLDLENQIQTLQDKLKTQETSFRNVLNASDSLSIDLPDSLPHLSFDLSYGQILDSILVNNHEVLNLEFQQAAAAYDQVAAKKMGNPNISVGIDYLFIGKSDNSSLSASESGRDAIMFPQIGLTVPIYRKKYTAKIQEAVFKEEALQNQQVDKKNVLETVFSQAMADFDAANRNLEILTKQLQLAQKAMRILETAYAGNSMNFEEILRMEQRVLKYHLELEKAKTDSHAAASFINYLMGK